MKDSFLGLYQTLDLISDGKESHFENNINNNNNNCFLKKKTNLLTYINVFMENSLNESEENSQSCPAKTWFYDRYGKKTKNES